MSKSRAPYQITLQPEAVADLEKLDPEIRRRVRAKLMWLGEHAEQVRHHQLSADLAELCKRRVGSYRILYQPLARERRIVVHRIAHRRDVYGGR